MTIHEITENITITSAKGIKALQIETDEFLKLIKSDLDKLVTVANDYKKRIIVDTEKWEAIKKEISVLEKRRNALLEEEKEVNKKAKRVSDDEQGLVELHKVLDNRRRVLDKREVEIKEKERRLS